MFGEEEDSAAGDLSDSGFRGGQRQCQEELFWFQMGTEPAGGLARWTTANRALASVRVAAGP